MGEDKASLVVDGERLASRVAGVLQAVADLTIVASGDGRRLMWLGLPQVADIEQGEGPLAGLVPGLEAATTPYVAVVAVDMPNASAPVFRLLAERASGHDAAVPRTEDGVQPLHAVYATAAAARLRASFEGGVRSVRQALGALDLVVVEPAEWSGVDPAGRFAVNINRPGDLPG
jgi:molybdopterin-guanine dinucleotide biosynthesis protein A